jgi:Toprim domain
MSTEEFAQRIWDNAGSLKGPVVEAYFAWRGLAVPKTDLRFAPSLWHKKSGGSYPAIIARATNVAGVMTGIQRMWLALDGVGKAPVPKDEQKMALGLVKGSMVRLAEPVDGAPLLIGEGLETVLTPMQATGYTGAATLGTSGLKALDLPDGFKDVILLGENDGGKSAAAIAKAAPELKKRGIRVRVAWPVEGFKDFNDMVMGAADRTAAFAAVRKAIEDAEDFVDPLDDLLERTNTDPGVPFEPETLRRLAELRANDQPAFERLRSKLKEETDCRLGELDAALLKLAKEDSDAGDDFNQAETLIEIAKQDAELFHAADDTAFADVRVNGHRETYAIKSKGFDRWLRRRFYETTRGSPNSDAFRQAIAMIEAVAHFEGPEREIFVRVGRIGAKVYLDLGDKTWRAIEIDAAGWRVIDDPPIRFRRSAGMRPLPVPMTGGSVDDLRPFVNIQSDCDFVLVVSWLHAVLRGRGPYPVLVVAGEQGTAKSTFTRILRALIDPNTAARPSARGPRSLHLRGQQSFAGVRQCQRLVAAMDLRCDLQARDRRRLCHAATLYRRGRSAVRRHSTRNSERDRRRRNATGPRPTLALRKTRAHPRGQAQDRG